MKLELKGKKVIVLGLGDTGMSMARWLTRRGAIVSVADTRADPPHAAQLTSELPDVTLKRGEFHPSSLHSADVIAISPGVDRRTPAVAEAVAGGVPVVGDIELFAQAVAPRVTAKILAVTGTNGKSTVTRMAGDICAAAGLAPMVAGNIGTPVLDALLAIEDGGAAPAAFVLELSSFQLESTASFNADAATVLNISEDHLDRHDGIENYAAAKARVFGGSGAQVLNRDDARSSAMALPGRAIHRFGLSAPRDAHEWGIISRDGASWLARGATPLLALADLPVAGMHNAANALAASALCHAIGIDDESITGGLRSFRGLPHRTQKIAELHGIAFYDDSKGTNVGATVAALNGCTQPAVLIAGGDGKGQDFGPLLEPVTRHARAVVLIGRDRERIATALAACNVPLQRAEDMQQAVQQAYALSRNGDVVLLSPACASYDMFRNYGHRGDVFAAAVRELVKDDGR